MQQIRLTPVEWSALTAELAKGPTSKIAAIKIVRDASTHQYTDPSTGNSRPGVGLREAKEAVEHYMTSKGMMNSDGTLPWRGPGNPTAKLVPMQPIKRIVVDMGDGVRFMPGSGLVIEGPAPDDPTELLSDEARAALALLEADAG
jgi:hypothetical protein